MVPGAKSLVLADAPNKERDDTCMHKRAGAAAEDEAVLFTHPAPSDRTKTSWDGIPFTQAGAFFPGLSFSDTETWSKK
jgi:hypothetical protein